jgi:hypothetical protein
LAAAQQLRSVALFDAQHGKHRLQRFCFKLRFFMHVTVSQQPSTLALFNSELGKRCLLFQR